MRDVHRGRIGIMSQGEEFKSLDRSRRKQAIVETAARIFHEKGYH